MLRSLVGSEMCIRDSLFPGLQLPDSINDTNGDSYDNVIRDSIELNPTDDDTKETCFPAKETSPDTKDTRNLRRSSRLRDPYMKAFVSVHNYANPAHSPYFHSPTKLNNKTLSVALDDIGSIHCNDPLTIAYTYPWLKTLSLCVLSKNPSSLQTNHCYSNPLEKSWTRITFVKGRQGQTHPRPSSLARSPGFLKYSKFRVRSMTCTGEYGRTTR